MTKATTGNEIDPNGVDHPIHYNTHPSGIECIDLIRGLSFDIGSAVKYVMRRGEKGDALKDLRKAEWYLYDHLHDGETDYGSPSRRLDKIPAGSLGHRWRWDQVITHELDMNARSFYLAVSRFDLVVALTAVRAMIAELDPPQPEVTADHPFEAFDGATGRACTRLVKGNDGSGADCGLPPKAHPRG